MRWIHTRKKRAHQATTFHVKMTIEVEVPDEALISPLVKDLTIEDEVSYTRIHTDRDIKKSYSKF